MPGYIFIFVLLNIPIVLFGQRYNKAIEGGHFNKRHCKKYITSFNSLPIDIRFGVEVVNGNIFLSFTSEQHFLDLFNKKNDGIIIEIVDQNDLTCDQENIPVGFPRGDRLPFVSKRELISKIQHDLYNSVFINLGRLPSRFDPNQVECNLYIVQRKSLCDYRSFSNMDFNDWELLPMRLILDSGSNVLPLQLPNPLVESVIELSFDRNSAELDNSQLLSLEKLVHPIGTEIKKVSIEVFSSVEGTEEINFKLGQKRILSVSSALRSLNKSDFAISTSSTENWGDFYLDIKKTQYDSLKYFDKSKTRFVLSTLFKSKSDSTMLESILRNHRKARVTITFQEKLDRNYNADQLISLFNQSISRDSVGEALLIQNHIFKGIESKKLSTDILNKLEIPPTNRFGTLMSNSLVYNHFSSMHSPSATYDLFSELLTISPSNQVVLYNFLILKMSMMTYQSYKSERDEIINQIRFLKEHEFASKLIQRLELNSQLLSTEFFNREKEFKKKNQALRHVYSTYSKLNLSDNDLDILAKYLALYSRFDWAESILRNRGNQIDCPSYLLDSYLRLKLNNTSQTIISARDRTFYEQVANSRKEIFCDLFEPTSIGGFSMQLLTQSTLRELYCQFCDEK